MKIKDIQTNMKDESERNLFYNLNAEIKNNLENYTAEIENKLTTFSENIGEISSSVSTLASQMGNLTSSLENLSNNMSTLSQNVDNIDEKYQTLNNKNEDLSNEVLSLSNQMKNLLEEVIPNLQNSGSGGEEKWDLLYDKDNPEHNLGLPSGAHGSDWQVLENDLPDLAPYSEIRIKFSLYGTWIYQNYKISDVVDSIKCTNLTTCDDFANMLFFVVIGFRYLNGKKILSFNNVKSITFAKKQYPAIASEVEGQYCYIMRIEAKA